MRRTLGVYCPRYLSLRRAFAVDKAAGHLDPLKLTVNINATAWQGERKKKAIFIYINKRG